MFTDNFIAYTKAFWLGSTQSMKDINNTSFTIRTGSVDFSNGFGTCMKQGQCKEFVTSQSTLANNSSGVFFGSGSTPASKADVALEAPITTGLSIINPSNIVQDSSEAGKYEYSATFTVNNTTSDEINIYEIGLFMPMPKSTSLGYCVLMERTVLTEPITLKAGQTKIITYKVTFNQTLNVEA